VVTGDFGLRLAIDVYVQYCSAPIHYTYAVTGFTEPLPDVWSLKSMRMTRGRLSEEGSW
jgi:hypothetical protein